MTRILTFCGSLRAASVNAATMRAATALTPDDVEFVEHDISEIPFYNGDVEDAGFPAPVVALHEAMAACDGLMIFSPEYNGSYPAIAKNVIDWLSRPPRAWTDKGITLVATSPGSRGGKGLRDNFDAVMAHMPVRPFRSLGIGKCGDKFDDGVLVDDETRDELGSFIAEFAAFCEEDAPPASTSW